MSDQDPTVLPDDDDDETFFVEQDPVASALSETALEDPSDYDPRAHVDDALPGVDAHVDDVADAIHDLLD